MPSEPKETGTKFGLLRQLQQKPVQEQTLEPAPEPPEEGKAEKQQTAKAVEASTAQELPTATKQQSGKAAKQPDPASGHSTRRDQRQSRKAEKQQTVKAADQLAPANEAVKQQSRKAAEEDEGEVHFTNYLKGSVSRRLQVYVAVQKAQQRRGGGERVSIKNVLNQALEEFLDRNGG